MTVEEMQNYIKSNWHEMESERHGVSLSIFEMCCNEDVASERIKNETYDVEFE